MNKELMPEQLELQGLIKSGFGEKSPFETDLATKLLHTDRQVMFVHRLLKAAQERANTAARKDVKVPRAVDRVIELLNKACGPKLKKPKIGILLANGTDAVTLNLADPKGRNPGYVYMKTLTKGYIGKISPEGKLYATYDISQDVKDAIVRFAVDPLSEVTKFAKAKGCCCFCWKTLDDPDSVSWGYGPICAKHNRLPHGSFNAKAKHIVANIQPDWAPLEAIPEYYYAF